jgi:prepilin-type N-terminal cleavage/methylation domain-containing protein
MHPAAARGFTLVETMVASTILGVSLVGTLVALTTASQQLKDSAIRQYRGELVDASLQRFQLENKLVNAGGYFNGTAPLASAPTLAATCSAPCNTLAIGTWLPDPTQNTGFVAGDISTGAYFIVRVDGEIQQLNATSVPAVATGTPCSAVPPGVFCREVLFTRSSGPIVSAGVTWAGVWPPPPLATTSASYTVWVRVSKAGDMLSQAIYATSSFAQ